MQMQMHIYVDAEHVQPQRNIKKRSNELNRKLTTLLCIHYGSVLTSHMQQFV